MLRMSRYILPEMLWWVSQLTYIIRKKVNIVVVVVVVGILLVVECRDWWTSLAWFVEWNSREKNC